jgi:hypothetical protein
MSGFEAFQDVIENLVNAFRGSQGFFHSLVDFAAVAVGVENGGSANGK